MPPVDELFEPADYSMAELRFLLEHLDETPNEALYGITLPPGVNKAAVEPALSQFSKMEEIARRKTNPIPWAGHAPIRESIERFIAWQEKSLRIQQQGGPRWPSMYSWDTTGAMYQGGIGSDSVEKVRHEITDEGERVPFAVNLRNPQKQRFVVPWASGGKVATGTDTLRHEKGLYHCSVCDKPVAFYDAKAGSRRDRNKARSAALKHCRTAKSEITRHRALANSFVE